MSAHHPVRLRVTLAVLVVVVAGTTLAAAVLLGSNQDAPSRTVEASALGDAGSVSAGPYPDPNLAPPPAPEMRLGVLDKDEAIREERRARADARALRALAAQQAAAIEFAAALADARAAQASAPTGAPLTPDPALPPAPAPAPAPGGSDGGGGGGGGGQGLSLYEKLDNIAMCESNQNPRAVREPYFGAFQFLWETWQTWGGGGNRPRDILEHSYVQQREVAANLARARGFAGSWPTCAARYGYT